MKPSLKFEEVGFGQVCRAENLVKQVEPAPKLLVKFNQPTWRGFKD
jgi:hypothetical protein